MKTIHDPTRQALAIDCNGNMIDRSQSIQVDRRRQYIVQVKSKRMVLQAIVAVKGKRGIVARRRARIPIQVIAYAAL